MPMILACSAAAASVLYAQQLPQSQVANAISHPLGDAKQADDFSDDGGSPNGRNKRVQANRLSAQRSRQRKLQKEADLTHEVDLLDRQIEHHVADERRLLVLEQGKPPACCATAWSAAYQGVPGQGKQLHAS